MKISNTIHSAFSLFFLLSLSAHLIQAETVEVAGYSFSSPSNWVSSVPTSKMRKAQFKVPGEKEKEAEVAFFYFGGGGAGGVKANVDRWMSQFEEAKGIEIKNTTIGDTQVT